MALPLLSLTFLAISAGASLFKAGAEEDAAEADLSAINQQAKLLALSYQQKNLQNLEATDKILSRQAAQLSARGVSYVSPSFNAIQRDTLNIASRKEGNLKAEEALQKESLEIEKQNVKRTLHAQLFGDAVTFSFGATEFLDKFPTLGDKDKLPQIEDL